METRSLPCKLTDPQVEDAMTAKEHRKWIRYWTGEANVWLRLARTDCGGDRLVGRLKCITQAVDAIGKVDYAVTELEKLEGEQCAKPRE